MKAIVSGMTSEMTTGTPRTGYPALSPGLTVMLEELGYETYQGVLRVDTNDEMLAEADVMILGMSPVISVGSRYLYGVLDAILKARQNNCALLFTISDWQTALLKSSLKTLINGPHRMTKYFMRHRTDHLWANHHVDYLMTAVNALYNNPWPGTLIPSHPWRNDMPVISNHVPARRLYYFDPTPVTSGLWKPHETQATPDERKREWVMAALGNYDDWMTAQNFNWPIRAFGGKTNLVDEEGNKSLNPRVKEPVIHQNYSEVWGGLAPAHALAGCGWWRSRTDFILKNGGILYGDPLEAALMGEPFQVTVPQIESATTQQLVEIQRAQVDAHQVESLDSVLTTLSEAIAAAKADI